MHCVMYAMSFYSELAELRSKNANDKIKVKYYSGAISQVQLFVEFFFEVLNEKDEPLVMVFEAFKAFFRLKEYFGLVNQEKINVYLDLDSYTNFKES